MIFRLLKQAWKDPVWSKVIAAAIIALAVSLFSAMNALYHNESFVSGVLGFWQYRLPVWANALITVGIVASIFILSPGSRKKAVRGSSMDQQKKGVSTIFQSAQAEPYECQMEQTDRGNMEFKNGILSIDRSIKEGSVMVRPIQYLNGTGKVDFVKRDLSGSPKRILRFSFDCRVIGGRHQLGVVVSRKDGPRITSKRFDIVSEQWEPIQDYLVDIPATEDFVIGFEDSFVERENSSIQLKNIKIEEIIS